MAIQTKLLPFLVSIPVFMSAFGFNEHRTIAAVAWMELTPEAREAVMNLLAVSDDTSMIHVSIWADKIKSQEKYAYAGTFHYVNIPVDGKVYDQDRDCPEFTCIVEVIPRYIETLNDTLAGDSLRNEALKFLIHLVGDIHQPMHCGLPEDRGGNDVHLKFKGKQVNLHGLWDYGINEVRIRDFNRYALKRHKAGSKMELVKILSVTDPIEWTNESYHIARSVAYKIQEGDKVSWLYERRARKYIDRRITIAGYRLAFLLNSIFVK